MKKRVPSLFIFLLMLLALFSCGQSLVTDPEKDEKILYISVLTQPANAKIYWHIVSSHPSVKSTDRSYLGRTPYRRATALNIPGLSLDNASSVVLVLEIEREGFYQRTERFNLKNLLSLGELSLLHHLSKREGGSSLVTKPESPSNVIASSKYKKYIKISWDSVDEAESYEVYRCRSRKGKYQKIAKVSHNKFLDKTAKVEKVYYYKIRSVNKAGFSQYSLVNEGYRIKEEEKEKEEKEESSKSGDSSSGNGLSLPSVPSSGGGNSAPSMPSPSVSVPSTGGLGNSASKMGKGATKKAKEKAKKSVKKLKKKTPKFNKGEIKGLKKPKINLKNFSG